MKQRIIFILLALTAIVIRVNAQSLSVQPIEVQVGEQTEMVVSLTGATEMTALQFNLQLPEGLTAETSSITLGSATDRHTLSVQTLNNGDLLFVLYSMNFKVFKDGELLRISITASNTETTSNGKLYTVRAANEMGGLGAEATAIVFKRNITASKWCTIVVPFDIASKGFIDGV